MPKTCSTQEKEQASTMTKFNKCTLKPMATLHPENKKTETTTGTLTHLNTDSASEKRKYLTEQPWLFKTKEMKNSSLKPLLSKRL
jgi:hypothetical protein